MIVAIGSTNPVKIAAVKSAFEKGLELGDADDIIFKTKNSKQKEGHFGHMTKNKITRTKAYEQAVISALTRFIHPNLF